MTSMTSSTTSTTFFVPNLHCPSCITNIESALASLRPAPMTVSHSIVSHSVMARHDNSLPVEHITTALESAGFEVHSVFQGEGQVPNASSIRSPSPSQPTWGLEKAVQSWTRTWAGGEEAENRKRKRHVEHCLQCQKEAHPPSSSKHVKERLEMADATFAEKPVLETRVSSCSQNTSISFVVVDNLGDRGGDVQATFIVAGMTCSSCVGNVSRAIEQFPWVRSTNVSLLTNSAFVRFDGKEHAADIIEAVEDAGYDCSLEDLGHTGPIATPQGIQANQDAWRATFAISGMTCSACVGAINSRLEQENWVDTVNVNLISNSATISYQGQGHLGDIKTIIEDLGYDADLDEVVQVNEERTHQVQRKIAIKVAGIYCQHCPARIVEALERNFANRVVVEQQPDQKNSIMKLAYEPRLPGFSIREIMTTIAGVDDALEAHVYHPPTIEERSRDMRTREQRRILVRLTLAVVVAIPTFIIGIVFMDLVPKTNSGRQYLMQSMWAGRVPRADWALFLMSTITYFFSADIFHIRTLEGVRAMWRPGSPIPLLQRFYRFGSMNMLITLGTSTAYFASIAELTINATSHSATTGANNYYFDSVVFLTMFLLIGRFLEAYSKAKTGEAVTALSSLRPEKATLINSRSEGTELESQQQVSVDLLEVGDVIRVPHGGSPAFDGVIVEGETKFDESSLTGEARLIHKRVGDEVFSGTVNKEGPTSVRLTTISGASMLDQIIKVVREGQAKRAPVERVADVITGHFVPFVILVGILTWIVWLALGLDGALPNSYRDDETGGWPFWSLQFSIAVFVVACPCGIGLAAPTALFVGGGLAAQHGILVKGGGEAFQEASTLDCVVFDKTGTLSTGGEQHVVDSRIVPGADENMVLGIVKSLEESSNHPIARAIVKHASTKGMSSFPATKVEELPGKGLKGTFSVDDIGEINALVGNEALMHDYGISVDDSTSEFLEGTTLQGSSVALLALGRVTTAGVISWQISAVFAIADPVRPESASVVRALQARGVSVWMITGDNANTAHAVGTILGLPSDHVIAGVLPEQKAEKIKWLQKTLPGRRSFLSRKRKGRATIAMVGDGINDAPALATADVGIAIGSGSDVALASAHFVLAGSDLTALLTLIDLSRVVFRRLWFNFGWALVYNLIALPIAAGVLYPVKSGGGHVRLDPVWASLAMALSSVSVVTSSLLLKTRLPGVGFRPAKSNLS